MRTPMPTRVDWVPIDEHTPRDRNIMVWPPLWKCDVSCARWNEDEYARKPRPYWQRLDAISVAQSRDNPPTHWAPIPEGPEGS